MGGVGGTTLQSGRGQHYNTPQCHSVGFCGGAPPSISYEEVDMGQRHVLGGL